jgi:hypothetical protein
VNEKLKNDDGAKKMNATLYRSSIGNFLYLIATKPNIMFVASILVRFMSNPRYVHFRAVK